MKCIKIFSVTLLGALAFMTGCKEEKKADAEATPEKVVESPALPIPGAADVKPEEPKDPNEVVASVGEKKYLRKDMDEMLDAVIKAQNVPPEHIAMAKQRFAPQIVNQFIMKTIFMDIVEKEGIKVTDEDRTKQVARYEEQLKERNKTLEDFFKESPLGEERSRKEFEDNLIIEKLFNVKILDKIEVSDADAEKHIADVKKANEELKNSDATAKTKIEGIKKQLDEGADFAELAKTNSDCPSGQKGGDLGPFGHGQMVPEFDTAAFAQEVGKVGDIVKTQFGYHLIKVTDKKEAVEAKGDTPATPETITASHILVKIATGEPAPVPTMEEAKEALKQQQAQPKIREYVEGLRKEAKIDTIFTQLLPPPEAPAEAKPAEAKPAEAK